MVDVDVDVRDPLRPGVQQRADRDRDVVVDAEAAGPVGHRVVQAAGDVDRVERVPAPDLAERLERRAEPVRVHRRVPRAFGDAVGACLEPEPDRRPTVGRLFAALSRLTGMAPATASLTST